jgi:DNA-binding response OmpR family regulator
MRCKILKSNAAVLSGTPDMSSGSAGRAIRQAQPRVVVETASKITAHTDDLDARLLGPRECYVVKPFTPATLVGAVRRLMPAHMLGLALR